MGTRSRIALQTGKSYLSIYVHWDGYPGHHGPILLNHYNTTAQIRELLALGDLSSLRTKIGEKQNFDSDLNPPEAKDWCLAYSRDRNEKYVNARRSKALIDLEELAVQCYAEYIYLFTSGGWTVSDLDHAGEWKDLLPETVKTKLTA